VPGEFSDRYDLGAEISYRYHWTEPRNAIALVSGLWFFSREARSSVDLHGPDDEEEDE
jgi:hypothetical protein